MAQGLQRGRVQLGGKTQPLEPVDDVVGEQEEVEVGFVGEEVSGRDAAQGVVAFELADQEFDSRAVVVQAPQLQRLQRQVGDEDLIVVAAHLEQGQLRARLLGLRPADDDEAIRPRSAHGTVVEFGGFHAGTHPLVVQLAQPTFDGSSQPRHDDKAPPLGVDPLHQLAIEKSFVGADNHTAYANRNLGAAGREHLAHPARGVDIAGPQLAVPEVAALAFEAQQRVIRPRAVSFRAVPNAGFLLLPVDDQNCRIEIEDQPRRDLPMSGHPLQQAIVHPSHSRQRGRRRAQQKTPQRGRIGIRRQTSQILEDPILAQQAGGLEALQPQHHRIEHGEDQLPDAVAIVALRQSYFAGHGVLETNAGEKPMKQVHTSVMRQRFRVERNCQFAWPARHFGEPYPKGSFHRNAPKAILPASLARSRNRSCSIHA